MTEFEKWWVVEGNACDTEGSYDDALKIFQAGRQSMHREVMEAFDAPSGNHLGRLRSRLEELGNGQ